MRIFLKTEDEIDLMREANQLVGKALAEVGKHIKPGVTTAFLNDVADEFIRDHGAVPSFKNCPNPFGKPFPAAICTSVNNVVVHGIPSENVILKDGDVISVDCGVLLNGYNGDSCYTFSVGTISNALQNLLSVTRESLYKAISVAVVGKHVGDISYAIQSYCESFGYGVVKELTGHGIGRQMHEAPQIPNYGEQGRGILLKEGMCISIEPMITLGDPKVWLLPDHWGIITRDGKQSAHFEHTIVVRHGHSEILSSFEGIEHLEGNI